MYLENHFKIVGDLFSKYRKAEVSAALIIGINYPRIEQLRYKKTDKI